MRWSGFWIGAVSAAVLLIGEQMLQACGPSPDPYDYYPSFFDNRLPERPAFGPFRYSAFTGLFYEDWYSGAPDSVGDTSDANADEWVRYTGGLPKADVDSFVYAVPRTTLAALYGELEKAAPATLPDGAAPNRMAAWFRQSRDLEALGYLMYAKQCEPLVSGQSDPWTVPPRDTVRMGRLLKNGLQLHAAAQKEFIKNRYTYQVLRLALYSGQATRTLQLYDSLGAAGATGEMATRIAGLQAGALYKLKRYDEAAYRYSLLFDRSDAWKRTAFTSYDWSKGFEQETAVLKRCINAHERAVVHLLHGLHEYEEALPELEKAYTEDPMVTGLDAVFTRELNKVEERSLQNALLSQRPIETPFYWSSAYWEGSYDASSKELSDERRRYGLYPEKLTAFAQRVAAEGKVQRTTYWHLALAYLAFLENNAAAVTTEVAAAEKAGLTPLERDQAEMLRLLAVARSGSRITPEVEAKMLPGLQWLDARGKASARLDKSYRDFTGALLAGAYLAQGDTVKGLFALARAQRHWNDNGRQEYSVDPDFGDEPGSLLEATSDAQLQAVKAYTVGSTATAYDRWLTSGDPYPLDVLYELEGTRLLRRHRFADAATAFQKSTEGALRRVLLPDPFVAHLRDELELEAEDTVRWYTKRQFAERMAALEGKTDAQSRFQWGTGLYAMTYYGKAHHAFDYYRSSVDEAGYYEDTSRATLASFQRDYYDARSAEAAFVQCAAVATDPELKAKALFMAAKCWQKRCPSPHVNYSYERDETKDYYRNSLKNPYFGRLKAEAGKTALYGRAVSTCEYLADYAKRK